MILQEIKNLPDNPQNRKRLHVLIRENQLTWKQGLEIAMYWSAKKNTDETLKSQFIEAFGPDDPEVLKQADEVFGT